MHGVESRGRTCRGEGAFCCDHGKSRIAGEGANELSTIAEGVVISTCNRVEFYVAAEDRETGLDILQAYLAEGRDAEEMKYLYQKCGDEAKSHLFALVCGLDSMVLGETEIFGQVKHAYQQALEAGATKGFLNRLFQKSFAVGKRIRTQTRIQMGATSVGNVALIWRKKYLAN